MYTFYHHLIFKTLAGEPAATTLFGISLVTKLLAPTTQFDPIDTPFKTVTFMPSHVSCPIKTSLSSVA